MSFKSELKKFQDKMDLTKLYPGYFTKRVFQLTLVILLFLAVTDFVMNDFSFHTYTLNCPLPNNRVCVNPYYVCGEGESSNSALGFVCVDSVPDKVCSYIPCHKKTFSGGESYGRTDFLALYGDLLMFLLVVACFIVNHLVYLGGKKWPKKF